MPKNINKEISGLNYEIEKLQYIQQNYSDATYQSTVKRYCSPRINKLYSDIEFSQNNSHLYISPFSELKFNYSQSTTNFPETIKIYSLPFKNTLAYTTYVNGSEVIRFCNLQNLKNRLFKPEIIAVGQREVLNFIQKHPRAAIDDSKLDPKLKKLILFI